MAPAPTGTARCMARPRRFSRRAASRRLRAPAAARAVYSPREWPATKAALSESLNPPSLSSTASTARLTAIRAGWAFSVRVRSASGPSNMSRVRRCPRASSISSKTRRAEPKASASARPIPTAWDPWPGKTKPVDIQILPPPAPAGRKWRALRPAPAGVSSRSRAPTGPVPLRARAGGAAHPPKRGAAAASRGRDCRESRRRRTRGHRQESRPRGRGSS